MSKSGFGLPNGPRAGKSPAISDTGGSVKYDGGSVKTTRENTASGQVRQGPYSAQNGAALVAQVMTRQEKVQGTSNGGKFEIISENQAYHAQTETIHVGK